MMAVVYLVVAIVAFLGGYMFGFAHGHTSGKVDAYEEEMASVEGESA